ncbi:phage tail tape measure protein [Brachybacterium paraconglomeratum]|uniref:phage tail tape measure protein n=1 Tax=Brachybacterium paraconglomeratum TaxID=173362 RepID=UPI00223B29ED|nr:phage tail tape measure protein [Brachybacterium paraconglomeratum]MCT1437169.1 phage tail tape measure protein [Brachybacterium paraconglomeratum]
MAERSIVVRLRAEVNGYKQAMAEASKATEGVAKSAETSTRGASKYLAAHKEDINQVSTAAAIGGAALLAFSGISVTAAAEFDAAMSNVQAGSMESADNMELLRQAALDAGASTVYSATEAAGAIEQLAKAGLSTQDILGGGLTGALDLAASGGIDVAEAAEIASVAMKQFGLEGQDVSHIADLLAAGAGKAVGDVDDLGNALNQAGTVANSFGLSVDETVGGLAAFAEAGMIGSDAGTMLKTMLQQLGNPTEKSAELMKELGISVYDANGEFIGLDGVAGQLETAFQGMDMESRNAAMGVIFGADAIRGANVLYEQGEEGIQAWNAAVNDQGYAAEQAALRLDNLKGDIEGFRGALETAFIGMGEGSQGPLRGLVQGATDVVNAFNELPDAAKSALGMGAGIGGLGLLAVGGLGKVVTSVSEVKAALGNLGIAVETTGQKLRLLGIGSGVALAVTGLAMAVSHFASESVEAQANADALASTFDELTGAATASTDTMILEQINEHLSAGDWDQLEQIGYSYSDVVNAIKEGGPAYDQLWEDIERTRIAANTWTEAGREQSGAMSATADALRDVAPAYQLAAEQQAELSAGQEQLGATAEQSAEAQAVLDAAVQQTGVSVEGVIEDMQTFLDLLFETGLATMSARDAQAEYYASVEGVSDAVDGLIEEHGSLSSALNGAATDFDLTTEAGREANSAFQQVAQDGMALVEAKAREGAGLPELQSALDTTYDDLISVAGQFGITGDAADDLARDVLGIPDDVDIETWMSDQAERQANATKDAVNNIPGNRTVTVTTVFRTIGTQPTMTRGRTTAVGAWASGGPVYGPGTGTSDSIPALLSNGEHVMTAREVALAGGHDAVDRMRASIRSGVLRFANGGGVQDGAYAPSMTPASRMTPASSMAYSGASIDMRGLSEAVRAGSAQGAAEGVSRFQPVVKLGDRQFVGAMVDGLKAMRAYGAQNPFGIRPR